MPSLKDTLLAPGTRPAVVTDCVRLIDEEVASKGGLSGLAIKGAYAVVKKVKPGFIDEAVDNMLEDFVGKLDPFYLQAVEKSEPIGPYMNARPGEIAEALLSISDERARRAKNQMVKGAYDQLRPKAKEHVQAAVPRIGKLVAKHAGG